MITTSRHRGLATLLTIFAVLHSGIGVWHGAAHLSVPVPLSPLQMIFVALVVMTAPLVAAGLLWTPRWRLAAGLYTSSMLAALLFGLINHYLLVSADNVAYVPAGDHHEGFVVSAGFIAGSELIGTVLGLLAMWTWSRSARD